MLEYRQELCIWFLYINQTELEENQFKTPNKLKTEFNSFLEEYIIDNGLVSYPIGQETFQDLIKYLKKLGYIFEDNPIRLTKKGKIFAYDLEDQININHKNQLSRNLGIPLDSISENQIQFPIPYFNEPIRM